MFSSYNEDSKIGLNIIIICNDTCDGTLVLNKTLERVTEFARVTIVTIGNFRDISSIIFTGNLDLISFIKKLDSYSTELWSLPPQKELFVNGQRDFTAGKMSRKQHFMMTPRSLILYSKWILVKAETITPLEQWEEGICVIHISHDGLSNFLHNLWLQHSLVLVIIGTISRELYTYCSPITFCQCHYSYQTLPMSLKLFWCCF